MTPDQFMAMLAEGDRETRGRPPVISPEGQIARMREFAERYAAPCPFKIGDLVTPRRDSNVTCKGEPHLVVDLGRLPPVAEDVGSHVFGACFDMRVVHVQEDRTIMHWCESVYFEAYQGEPPR